MECPSCSGKGQKTTSRGASYPCKACSGEGSVECPKECSSCNGSGEITEQLQNETREKYRPKFANLSPANAATVQLIILNVAIYGLIYVAPGSFGYLSLGRASLALGYYWTIITSSFVHYDGLHLLLNMVFLWYYGPVLEGILGKLKYLGVYLFCSLTAGAVSWLGNITLDGNVSAGVGASGPLYGIVGALLGIHLRWRIVQASGAPRLATWAFGLMIVGFGLSATSLNFLDNWGHLGGALGGLVLGYLMPRPTGR